MAHAHEVNLPASGKSVTLYVDWTEATSVQQIKSGIDPNEPETLLTSMGKIAKWKTEFKKLVFTDLSISSGTAETGKAITALSYNTSTGVITATKGTFLTAHPSTSTQTDTTSEASPAHGGTFTTVDSVTRDSYGHVTKINTKTVTLPSDQNTDTKVTQTNTTNDADYRVLFSANANNTTETTTSRKSGDLIFNPSTKVLSTGRLSLKSTTAPAITVELGSLAPTAGQNVNVLTVKFKNTDGTKTHTVSPIAIIGNDATGDSATYNSGVRLGSTNGTTIVAAGDSSTTFAAAKGKYNDENLYLVADASVLLYRGMSNDSTTGSGPWTVGGFTETPTSGQVIIADGTVGGYKTSGYTIAKSVPSNALFTDHITTATTSGSGNAVTAITADADGALTVTKGSTFSLSTHTHNYAGSSSAGGAATSANKLNTDAGGVIKPVYFSNGVPVACNAPASGTWWNTVSPVNSSGVLEIGRYIDFHCTSASTNNYDVRLDAGTSNKSLIVLCAHETDGPWLTVQGKLPKLKFIQTTSGYEYNRDTCGITAYPGSYDAGLNLIMQSGGNTIIGSGEIAGTFMTSLNDGDRSDINKYPYRWRDNGEQAYLAADEAAYIWTNGASWDSTKKYFLNLHCFIFSTNGNFVLPVGGGIYYQHGTRDANTGMVNAVVQSGLVSAATTTARTWTLPNATGTIALKEISVGSAYIKSRDTAGIYANSNAATSSSLFYTAAFVKTNTGGWSIGTLPSNDKLYFLWTTDENYNNNNNSYTTWTIDSDGLFTGTAADANAGKHRTSEPSSGTFYGLTFHASAGTEENKYFRTNSDLRTYLCEGTTSAKGYSFIVLGNATASGTAGNKYGGLRIYTGNANYCQFTGERDNAIQFRHSGSLAGAHFSPYHTATYDLGTSDYLWRYIYCKSGVLLRDNTNNVYGGLYDNGTNLWIGAITSSTSHHVGGTYISAGYDSSTSKGNSTIKIAVPNDANNGATTYSVYHTGLGVGKDGFISFPNDGQYTASAADITGALVITCPFGMTNIMMSFTVDIYNYIDNECVSYRISGYNYSTGPKWVNCSASSFGDGTKANLTVRFGYNGTKAQIQIGETNTAWKWPQVRIRDILLGHQSATDRTFMSNRTGWTITFVTTNISNITKTITDTQIYSLSGHTHAAGDITSGTLPIARGGTSKTTALEAITALGGPSIASVGTNIGSTQASPVDLDTYTTPGTYYSANSTESATITNGPTTGSGYKLWVSKGYGTDRIVQFAIGTVPSSIWMRTYNPTANPAAWTNWSPVISDANVTQTNTTGDASYRVLLSGNANDTTETTTSRKTNKLTLNTSTGMLTVGYRANNATYPVGGLAVHDIRSCAVTPANGDKMVNFYFTHNDSSVSSTAIPYSSGWATIIHVRGYSGAYNSWELAGPSNNTDQTTTPLYVRTSNAGSTWGSWRKIYDSSNPPTYTEVGAASSSHNHNSVYIPLAGSNAISGSLETNSTSAGFIVPGSNGRKMSLMAGAMTFTIGTSNWASGINFYKTSVLGQIGAHGTGSSSSGTCDYFFMGRGYNDYSMRLENDDAGKMTLCGTLPQLKFQQTTTGKTRDNDNIGIIAHPASTNGMNMTIQSDGNMIIGAGEYPVNFYNASKSNSTTYPDYWSDDGEQMYVGSDNNVIIHTNANTIANRKGFMFTTAGNLQLAEGGGILFKYATSTVEHKLTSAATTTARTWTLPNATGTIALTSNIPSTYAGSTTAGGAATTVTITNTENTSEVSKAIPFHDDSTGGPYSLLTNDGLGYRTLNGTASALGISRIVVGNATATGTAGNKYGVVRIYSRQTYYADIQTATTYGANRTFTLPNKTGTFAVTGAGTWQTVSGVTDSSAINTYDIKYRKGDASVVEIRGSIKFQTLQASYSLTTLPSGYCPDIDRVFPIMDPDSGGYKGRLRITSAGVTTLQFTAPNVLSTSVTYYFSGMFTV